MVDDSYCQFLPTIAARHLAREALGRWPSIYLPLARVHNANRPGCEAVDADTDLVIEGFPRCANTFAYAAFREAPNRDAKVAHHLHSPAQVIYAVKHIIPCLVLIRDPESAVASRLLMTDCPWSSPQPLLREYNNFYRLLLSYRQHFVVATFEEVIEDFGAVVRRLNARYGTTFTTFTPAAEGSQRCVRFAEKFNQQLNEGQLDARDVSRPTASRRHTNQEARRHVRSPAMRGLLIRSFRLYRRYVTPSCATPRA